MRKMIRTPFIFGALLWAVPGYSAAAGPRTAVQRNSPLADSLRKPAKAPGAAAREAFSAFVKKTGGGAWRVRYSPKTALPEALVGAKTARYPGAPSEAAFAFLNDNKDLLKVDPGQLRPVSSRTFMGVTHLQYDQVYNSVPVEFAYVRVHVNSSGEVTGYQAKFEPGIDVPLTPALPAASAESVVLSALGFSARITGSSLVLFPDPASDGALKLAWKVRARAEGTASGVWVCYVSAADGTLLFRYNDLRYACAPGNAVTTGTVNAAIYPISPVPTAVPSDIPPDSWVSPVIAPVTNQYVWVTDNKFTPTQATWGDAPGDYCSPAAGKVFASLKGPYFSVVNSRGPSAHFDNGGSEWLHYHHTPGITASQSFTVPDDWSGGDQAFAKVMPHFASFSVGSMDVFGDIADTAELHVTDSAGNKVASYIGSRVNPFFGAPVENRTYGLVLDLPGVGAPGGFTVDISSYLVLTNSPLVADNATGSILWSTGAPNVHLDHFPGNIENDLAEANAFYHLNKAYDYFSLINKDPAHPSQPPADLSSRQVPVMVHASGSPDASPYEGMLNAFYDLEKDNIFLGDGPVGAGGAYRSFALDGTIIRHEYIHRVVNQIYPIINFGEFGALSEAMADYFSLTSFLHESRDISVLGNFIVDAGEGAARDLGGAAASMPASWIGEIHSDSLILSQALWTLRKDGTIGPFVSGTFSGMNKIDVFTYAALFYFPDNFANFYDAFVEACNLLDPGCSARSKIDDAFGAHGILSYMSAAGVDGYDNAARSGSLCGNNNGPECATDISTMTRLSATVFPEGDADYYALPLAEGSFTAALKLPATPDPDFYYAYAMYLFDADRNNVAEAAPVIADPINGYSDSSGVSLTYSVPAASAGRFYLLVAANPNGNPRVASVLPYTLTLDYTPKGSAQADLVTAVFDQDNISFSVPYANFPMAGSPSSSTLTGAESSFQYAQLRDHNYQPLALARTDVAGGYLSVVPGSMEFKTTARNGQPISSIWGSVRLNPGFDVRYPGVGTVYLEIFGLNHMGRSLSLGVSNAINLSTNRSDLTTYNNILTAPGDRAIIKYDVQSAGDLSIKIYTVTGSLIKTVHDGPVPAGKGTVDWDGTNSGGSKVASGIYFVKAKGPKLDKVDKIAVVR